MAAILDSLFLSYERRQRESLERDLCWFLRTAIFEFHEFPLHLSRFGAHSYKMIQLVSYDDKKVPMKGLARD